MTEVQPITKDDQLNPVKVECPCRCGKVGALKKKPNKDGLRHVKGCAPCHSCQGLRNRTKGRQSQAKAKRSLGIASSKYRGKDAHEENWHDPFNFIEHKNDLKNAKLVVGAFRRMETQALASKAIGDPRTFLASVEWDGEELVVQRKRDWRSQRKELAS